MANSSENPVVFQSMRLEVSAFPVWHCGPRRFLGRCWTSVYIGSLKKVVLSVKKPNCGTNSLDEFSGRVRACKLRAELHFFLSSWLGCHQQMLPPEGDTHR